MFVRNAWYVAAIERDVSRTMLPLTLLGERVVLFAREDGTPVALEDACPQRRIQWTDMGTVENVWCIRPLS